MHVCGLNSVGLSVCARVCGLNTAYVPGPNIMCDMHQCDMCMFSSELKVCECNTHAHCEVHARCSVNKHFSYLNTH